MQFKFLPYIKFANFKILYRINTCAKYFKLLIFRCELIAKEIFTDHLTIQMQ